MKRASSTLLPSCISAIRLVAWNNREGGENAVNTGTRATPQDIVDVVEFNSAAEFRRQARLFAEYKADSRTVEIVSSDPRMKVKATVEKGIPQGCRTEQVCIRLSPSDESTDSSRPLNDVLLSLDRFWDLLCETATEMQEPSHFCNDECRCNNE